MAFDDPHDDTRRIVIVGAGNWGTTLARLYADRRKTVLLTRNVETADRLLKDGVNQRYLPELELPGTIDIRVVDPQVFSDGDIIILAVPSHQVGRVIDDLEDGIDDHILINAAKGFEAGSLRTLTEMLHERLRRNNILTLSGPNIALEIANGKPARAILAGMDMDALSIASRTLKHDQLVLEISRDQRGVELCGSLKGILAISMGLSDGFDLGDNFNGLLTAYGLMEFKRLAMFMGATAETVYGIAGLGDLITSSLSPAGRNRRFGNLLARGVPMREALDEVGMVVEGVKMLSAVSRLEDMNMPLPLFSAVRGIVFGTIPNPREALVDTVLYYGANNPRIETLPQEDEPARLTGS